MKKECIIHQYLLTIVQSGYFPILLMMAAFGSATATDSRAQNDLSRKVTLVAHEWEFKKVLLNIEKQTDFRFIFSSRVIDSKRTISYRAAGEPLALVLDHLLKPLEIDYEISGKIIILSKKESPSSSADIEIPPLPPLRQLSGTVRDENGEILPGVTILIKGTSQGTTTDQHGSFSLSIPDGPAVMILSFVGYLTQEVETGDRTQFDIVLQTDNKALEEVVVVGYGTQKKSDLTGAVSSVSEEKLQSRPVTGFNDALQGRAGGVQVRQSGGDLSGNFSIAIRGIGSVTGNSDPLIVVDGIPLFSANFSTINPKDIASIDILKDASATAIYGARAANGVVIITTRQGKSGHVKFTFNTDLGIEQITKRYDLMTTEEQRRLFVEGFKNANRDISIYDDPTHPSWQVETDWQRLGTRTGFRQNYNLGFSGGSEKTQFSGSVGYLNREGILVNTDLKSWSLRLNLQSKVKEWLKISSNMAASYQKQNYQNNDNWGSVGYRSLVHQHSYTLPYDEQGNLTAINTTAAPYFGSNDNPLIELLLPTRRNDITRILGNVKMDFQITPELLFTTNLGADISDGGDYSYLPVFKIGLFNRPEGIVTERSVQQINWVTDAFLTYQKNAGNHSLSLLAGLSAQQFSNKDYSVTGRGTIDNSLNQLSNQTSFNASGSEIIPGLASGFLRLNYGYQGKYLLTATIRRDGSSRFGPENKFGTFPSASVAWRISEEAFISGSPFLHDLKIRASYGLTGNQNIGNFAFITRAVATPYVFGNTVTVGNSPQNIGNPNLQWETAEQMDAGIDFSIFRGRISGTIDYYLKNSRDLLVSTPIPLTSGVTEDPILNIGSLRNSGVEFSFTSRNIHRDAFSWTTDFNITYNRNKVLDIGSNSIGNPLSIPGELIPLSNQPTNLTRAGRPVGAFYMYEFAGIWQLGEEEAAQKWSGAVPGDPRYTDLNGNGLFDEGDKMYVGNPHPRFFGGMDNTFRYKDFSISVFLNFSTGNQLYNTARNLFSRAVPFVQNFAEVNDFWTPQNPSNNVPRPSQGGNTTTLATMVSTRFLENADFLRVKNISLAYRLPKQVFGGKVFQAAEVTLSGTNLFTFTGYQGLDPEASSRSSLLSAGIDYTPYPLTKLISLGIKADF